MNEYTGKRLGSYQLLEQIGQGGMATIFKAYQPSMDRYVAVKILPRHFTEDETFVARFTQEARTLARLEHPHILPVHDYGEQAGITYLVMRYVDAGTLKELITRQDVLELDEVVRIMEQMGRALGYAHSLGVVHRDIKPSNVLIDERGDVFLTDFGIAKLVAGTSQFTATGAVIGTPAYMSPEQGLGETVDQRSDLYSLGVVLYEMATGRVPFEAETPLAVLLKHVNAPLPPPRQVKPDLPEAVERVILKAMAKSPDDRFETAEEMVEALQRAVAGLSTESALPGSPTEPDQTIAVPPSHEARVAFPQSETRVALGEEERAALLQETVSEPATAVPLPTSDVHPRRRPAGSLAPPLRAGEAAPPRRSLPFGRNLIPIVGGVAALVVVLIVALLVLSNPGGGEAEATRTPGGLGQLSPDWTNYTNGNFVRALARQGDYLWAGGGGLVRWDLRDGSYVKYGLASELSFNQINDLLVDGDGILWVATEAGLSRFDDDTWLTFDQADGLDSDEVETLLLDNDGALWAGTDGGEHGLNTYDGTSWGAPPVPALPVESPTVHHLSMETNYGLWASLGEEGLGYSDGVEWSLASEDGLPNDYVYALFLTEDDELWVSFYDVVLRRDPETGEWKTIPQLNGKDIYAIHQSRDGRFWFGGDAGAIRYDPATGDWQTFEPRPGGIPDWPITSIVEDEQGLWMGTEGGGVLFYDEGNWETWVTDDGLGGNDISAIRKDGSGALWFSHPGSGLSRYDPADDTWRTFGENEGALDWAYYPGVDPNGQLWVGGYDELKWYDGTAWRSTEPEQLAGAGTIFGIAFAPDGVAWLWSENGVIRYDPPTDERATFTAADHPVLEDVHVIYVAGDETVWAGSEAGLAYYDGSGWSGPDAEGDAPERDIYAIVEGDEGVLWVVADGALFSLEAGQWSRFDRPDDGWIGTLAAEPDSRAVWVGYDGLARFDDTNNDWQLFTTDDGLVNNVVQAIHVTSDGVVWVGTEAGVSRFVPEE